MLPIRVMLVDDNAEFLKVGRDLLSEEFTVVGTVENGISVSSAVAQWQPDVLVLDLSLGDVSGFDVAQKLKASGMQTRIVFFTVHESLDFVRAAKSMGAAGYVFKSRAAQDLTIAVARASRGQTFFPALETTAI